MAGFSEYFGHLDKAGREQVLGFTFDFTQDPSAQYSEANFQSEYQKLSQHLAAKSFERLQQERDVTTRVAVNGFAHQAAALLNPLNTFLKQAFGATKLELPTQVRGVYLVSGTQQGSPIDRVLFGLAKSFGFQGKALAPNKPSGKAFFLHGLLKDIIFKEAPLAGTNLQWERKLARGKWAAAGAALLLAILSVIAWTFSYFNNRSYVDEVAKNAEVLSAQVTTSPPAPGDIGGLLKLLTAVKALPSSASFTLDAPPLNHRWGLFQGRKLNEASQQTYQRLVQSSLAPYLVQRIEGALRKGAANPELQYETLKTYLMLRHPERLKAEDIKAWVAFDAQVNANPALSQEQREQLLAHTEVLLARNELQAGLKFDDQLVAQVQAAINRTPFPQRVFSRVKLSAAQDNLPEFRISNAGGDSAALVFFRPSGAPLSSGVPGLYSYNGYYKSFSKLLDEAIKKLAEEEVWVLGIANSDTAKKASNVVTRQSLIDDVKRLYLQEYASVWTKFLADIAIIKTSDFAQSITATQILSGPDSPLPRLLKAIVKEVTLTERPDVVAAATDKAADAVKDAQKNLLGLLGKPGEPVRSQAGTDNQKIESIVDDRFEGLRRLVKAPAPGQPAPIDQTVGLLAELHQHLLSVQKAAQTGAPAPSGAVISKIQSAAGQLPEPVKAMLNGLVSSGEKQAQNQSKEATSKQMSASIGEPCTKAVAGRYPFVPGSKADALTQDFATWFAPGGILDDFFQKNLAAQVDTSSKVWKFRAVGDQASGEASAALAQFQNAAEIRAAFFPGGVKTPTFRLEIRPTELDPSIGQLVLDVDGQTLKQVKGAITPQTVQWPGPKGSNQVRLQIAGVEANAPLGQGIVFDGPWALFRFFDAARIERTGGPERFNAKFSVDGKPVAFDITMGSVQNPFGLKELRAFRCPQKL